MSRQVNLRYFMLAAGFAGLLLGGHAMARPPQKPLMVPGEVIVKFRETVAPGARNRVALRHSLRLVRQLRNIRANQFRAPNSADPRNLARLLRRLPEVEYAEPNYYRFLDAIPNDPLFTQQYALDNQGQTGGSVDADIDAPEAWDITTGSRDVVVAVIDSGTDFSHQDLEGNLFVNPGEIAGNGIDDDGNGFVDDIRGWDFVDGDNDPTDSEPACRSHGVHTAGTIGALGNNGVGVSGIAHSVRLLPLRVFRPLLGLCVATDAEIIEAIDYAEAMGVDISSNSWGGLFPSLAVYDAIAGARQLFVAAAGNNGIDSGVLGYYPASYDLAHIVAVGATDADDQLAEFSNFGRQTIDLAAPGVGILSTVAGNTYDFLSGTSMATPHVAGAAALLLAADPDATPLEMKYRLLKGVDRKGLPLISRGRLNVHGSLILPSSPVAVELVSTGPTELDPGDPFSIDILLANNSAVARTFVGQLILWAPTGMLPVSLPVLLSLNPGESWSTSVNSNIGRGTAPGSYRLIGQVYDLRGGYFDEDQVILNVD